MTLTTQGLSLLLNSASPLPWMIATSNSWRRIVDAKHDLVCEPVTQPDGHPDLQFRSGGVEGSDALLLIEAVNALPELLCMIEVKDATVKQLRGAVLLLSDLLSRVAETHGIDLTLTRVGLAADGDILASLTVHQIISKARNLAREG